MTDYAALAKKAREAKPSVDYAALAARARGAEVKRGPSRSDESMETLREMAALEGLSPEEIDARVASPVGSTLGPAMVGATMLSGAPVIRAAFTPAGIGATQATIAAVEGKKPLDIAKEGAAGYVTGAGLGAIVGAAPGRLLRWLGRSKSAAPADVGAAGVRSATEVAEPFVLPAPSKPQWHGPRTPPDLLHQAARPPAGPAQAITGGEKTALEEQLRQSIQAVKDKAATAPVRMTPKLTPAQETMRQAQELEARIVDFKTRQGLSDAQIVNILKEQGIRERGMAKAMVDMVLKHHGLN